jgi:hypothetical protein
MPVCATSDGDTTRSGNRLLVLLQMACHLSAAWAWLDVGRLLDVSGEDDTSCSTVNLVCRPAAPESLGFLGVRSCQRKEQSLDAIDYGFHLFSAWNMVVDEDTVGIIFSKWSACEQQWTQR